MKSPTSCVLLAALGALAACGDDAVDPCDAVAGACITLHVESRTVDRIDHLELDVLYGDLHGTATTPSTGSSVVDLPLVTAIELSASTALPVGVVAAGKLAGVVLGTGAASTTVAADAHVELTIELSPVADCEAGGYYCGGDKLAGAADTLYQCNGGGVPLARGRCAFGCLVRPTQDDTCQGGGGTCVEGGFYCGGDKLDGDPQSLYRCSGGVGVDRRICANGCVVAPPGEDDDCR
jgi:hypothetical protein